MQERIFLQTELLGDFFTLASSLELRGDVSSLATELSEQNALAGGFTWTLLLLLPTSQQVLLSSCGTARTLRGLSLAPAQLCMTKAAQPCSWLAEKHYYGITHGRRGFCNQVAYFEVCAAMAYWGEGEPAQFLSGCDIMNVPHVPRAWLLLPSIPNGMSHCPSQGDNRVSNSSTPAVKFLKVLTFTPAKQVDIPLLNGRLIGAQIHLHEFSVFNRWH